MPDSARIPPLRFSGFANAWEQHKLRDLAAFSKGSGYSKGDIQDNGTPIILYGRLYTKYELVISDVDTFTTVKQGSVFSKGGEVIVPASGETAEDISIAAVVEKPGILLGGDLNIVSPISNLDAPFLALTISHGRAHNNLSKRAQGKSVVHLHNDDLQTIDVFLPCIREQQTIGAFFRHLDDLITLYQRKYIKLLNIKKAMLEKMFPRNGASVPEIRFDGFDGAWERRKLDEIVSFFSGLTYKPNDVCETGTLVLRSSNISDGEIVDADNVYVNPDVVNCENVKPGDIIIVVRNGSRALIGKHAEVKAFMPNTVIGAFMTGMRSDHPSFINALLNTQHFEEQISMNMGATINQITGYMFSKMEFFIPNETEQEAIGMFFHHLDNLIDLHRRKLERLQNIKKACLEKMLV